jgi:hypothetical protein
VCAVTRKAIDVFVDHQCSSATSRVSQGSDALTPLSGVRTSLPINNRCTECQLPTSSWHRLEPIESNAPGRQVGEAKVRCYDLEH